MSTSMKLDQKISIVMITRNRKKDVVKTLSRIYDSPERVPIVVVDNASTDGTPALIKKHYPEVRLIALPKNRGAVARSIGVAAITTPYVAFCDDDSWWHQNALS